MIVNCMMMWCLDTYSLERILPAACSASVCGIPPRVSGKMFDLWHTAIYDYQRQSPRAIDRTWRSLSTIQRTDETERLW